MAWLSLLLFLPWFLLLGSLYWLFPRQPRTPRRRLFDSTTLVLAFALSIVSMLWGYRIGVVQPGAGPIWPQVLAVLYAYGAFLRCGCGDCCFGRDGWTGSPAFVESSHARLRVSL